MWPVGRLLVGLLSGPTDAVGISGNVGDRILALGRVHSVKYGITSQRPAVVSQIMSVDRADVGSIWAGVGVRQRIETFTSK